MKKQIIYLTIIWISLLVLIFLITKENTYQSDESYKVLVNRIHQQLNNNQNDYNRVINNLTNEERKLINNIIIIDYEVDDLDEIEQFYDVEQDEKIIFKPIENTNHVVRYEINTNDYEFNIGLIVSLTMVTGTYVVLLINRIKYYRTVIKPLKKIKGITKQLANGHLREVNEQIDNKHFKEFIWGLDMLREQLLYEKNKNAELEKQQKTLVAGLSHDIKTPLSSVKNYALAVKEGIYETSADRDKALEIILDKVEVIEELTKELLTASTKEISNIGVNAEEIYMSEIHTLLDRLINQHISLYHIDYHKPVLNNNLMLLSDMNRLHEVFNNIIENALKYGDLNTLEVTYQIEENFQLIEIYNSGTKIPNSELKYIFNSYYRGSNVKDLPGYGLGLFISKQIMKQMQGDIFVKNNQDGVSFVIVIKQAG